MMNKAYDLALRYAQARFAAELIAAGSVDNCDIETECTRFEELFSAALDHFEAMPLPDLLKQ